MSYQHVAFLICFCVASSACGGGPASVDSSSGPRDEVPSADSVPNDSEPPPTEPVNSVDACQRLCQASRSSGCVLALVCEPSCDEEVRGVACLAEAASFIECALDSGFCSTSEEEVEFDEAAYVACAGAANAQSACLERELGDSQAE